MHITRSGSFVEFVADQESIKKILTYKQQLAEAFPRFAVFVISYNASAHIEKTISRIPSALFDAISEVYVFDDASPDDTHKVVQKIKESSPWREKLNVYRNPKNLGYGGNQKIGYKYSIEKGHDYAIMLHGDGQYAPEYIPDLILAALEKNAKVVFGSRMINKKDALAGGMPIYKWLGNQVLTTFENIILGTRLAEFHSGYRMYSTDVLKRIPFEENTNDFHFDTQIIIQCRALNVEMFEIPIKTYYGEEECNVNGMKYAKDVCLAVLDYRLHQLHFVRRTKYLVEHHLKFNKKNSPSSSHEKILKLIDKKDSGKILDLFSAHGPLLQDFKKRGFEITCVDNVDAELISKEIDNYCRIKNEDFESLHFDREFDYIILSDTLAMIKDDYKILRKVRAFLKENGRLIVAVPNIAIWFYRLSLLFGRFNYGQKGILDRRHLHFYTKDTIRNKLERAGYVVNFVGPTGIPFEVVFESVGKSRILQLIDRCYHALALILPGLFAYQFVISAEISSLEAIHGEGRLY